MRRIYLILCFLSAPVVLLGQGADRVDSTSTVVTSGLGEIRLAPDRARLMIQVQTRDSSAAAATMKNNVRLRRVLDSLAAMKQPDESIQVAGVSVRPSENLERGEIVGYDASANIRIALRNLERLGRLLDVAVRAGATGIEDIEFHSDREESARRDALARAYSEARANAQALAKAGGFELGPIVQISTEPDYGRYLYRGAALSGFAASGVQGINISPGDIRVAASVTTTWRLVSTSRR